VSRTPWLRAFWCKQFTSTHSLCVRVKQRFAGTRLSLKKRRLAPKSGDARWIAIAHESRIKRNQLPRRSSSESGKGKRFAVSFKGAAWHARRLSFSARRSKLRFIIMFMPTLQRAALSLLLAGSALGGFQSTSLAASVADVGNVPAVWKEQQIRFYFVTPGATK